MFLSLSLINLCKKSVNPLKPYVSHILQSCQLICERYNGSLALHQIEGEGLQKREMDFKELWHHLKKDLIIQQITLTQTESAAPSKPPIHLLIEQ